MKKSIITTVVILATVWFAHHAAAQDAVYIGQSPGWLQEPLVGLYPAVPSTLLVAPPELLNPLEQHTVLGSASISAAPEPCTMTLLAVGGVMAASLLRRRKV
jgi:hypothetical protein